jgi:hypothetical protein
MFMAFRINHVRQLRVSAAAEPIKEMHSHRGKIDVLADKTRLEGLSTLRILNQLMFLRVMYIVSQTTYAANIFMESLLLQFLQTVAHVSE